MISIQEIPPEQWAALGKFLGLYATGGQFRPVPLRQVRAVVHRLLGLRTEAGAYTDKPTARSIRLNNGLDPVTFEVIDQASFELAVSRAVATVGDRANGKRPPQLGSESSPEVLTPFAEGREAECAPMLRAIRERLGPAKAPLPKPLGKEWSKHPQPVGVPLKARSRESRLESDCQPPLSPASDKFAASDRSLADLSAECALRVRQRFGNL
jgi:hypothetical protein